MFQLYLKFFSLAATYVLSVDAPIISGDREIDNLEFNCSVPEHSEEAAELTWFVNEKEVISFTFFYTWVYFLLSINFNLNTFFQNTPYI